MPFRKFFGLAKKTKAMAAAPTPVVEVVVKVEKTVEPRSEETLQRELDAYGPVHVCMTFGEDGEMVSTSSTLSTVLARAHLVTQLTYKLAHLVAEAPKATLMVAEADKPTPVALSSVTTLVGSPMPMASNPATPFLTAEAPEPKAKLSTASHTTLVASELPEAKKVDEVATEPACERILTIDDFRPIRVLGEGGQGIVMLVHDTLTDKLFALKAIKKEMLHTKDFITAFVEQNVMQTFAGNPFFTGLKGSFEDDDHFYLITVSTHLLGLPPYCLCSLRIISRAETLAAGFASRASSRQTRPAAMPHRSCVVRYNLPLFSANSS